MNIYNRSMHKVLVRQLKKVGLTNPSALPDPEQWIQLLDRINRSYIEADNDRYTLERSLSISSDEMRTLYEELKESSESRLAESRDQLRCIINSLDEGLVWLDIHGAIRLLNPYGCVLLDVLELEADKYTLRDLFVHESTAILGSGYNPLNFQQVVSHGESWHCPQAAFHRLGLKERSFTASFQINPMYSGGRIIGAVMAFRDISLQQEQDARIRLWAEVFQNTQEGVIIADDDGLILAINAAVTVITGYQEQELIGKSPSILKSGKQSDSFYQDMWARLMTIGEWQGELLNRRKSGNLYPQWTTINAVRDAQQNTLHYIAVFSDISHIKRSEARLEYLAHHDQLTGLPNRFHFDQLLGRALEHQDSLMVNKGIVALMFMDLDRFKNINDTLGHQMGDQLLKKLSRRLTTVLDPDDVLARQGGDDFVILVPHAKGVDAVEERVQRILESMKRPFPIDNREIFVSCSLGISLAPKDGTEPTELFKKADSAMYHAKAAGGNCYELYSENFAKATEERFELEGKLRHALEHNEFILHYQPQFDVHHGRLTGIEALVRWNCPGTGMVPPDKFIPLAEETRLIYAIDAWVLNEACGQARAWQDAGYEPVRMAVNLSSHHFQTGVIVDQVRQALEQTRLDPQYLELELTESALVTNPERARETLEQLKQLGVQLAIDDFGTGYSSLSYLKHFSVDALKIDGSFIRDIPEDKNDEHIARAVIALGHSFMLRVIAEGVEGPEQIAFLRQEGCDELQGYYFSRPVAAIDLIGFLTPAYDLNSNDQ